MLHGLSVSRTLIKAAMGFAFDKVESAREVKSLTRIINAKNYHYQKLLLFKIIIIKKNSKLLSSECIQNNPKCIKTFLVHLFHASKERRSSTITEMNKCN